MEASPCALRPKQSQQKQTVVEPYYNRGRLRSVAWRCQALFFDAADCLLGPPAFTGARA
jgi:hypothetical protein